MNREEGLAISSERQALLSVFSGGITMENRGIQTKRIISIEKGHEYQPKHNDKTGSAEVFFYDVYLQAKYLMEDIVHEMDRNAFDENSFDREKRTLMARYKERADFYSINNVIAFCADRGNGKTSAMLSFANVFCASDNQLRENQFLSDTECLRDHTYVVLSSIDPTSIEPGGSFLSTIITRMFFYFQQAERNKAASPFYAYSDQEFRSKGKERSELLRQFQKCFSEVETLHKGNRKDDWASDGLERIAELGDSTNLRNSLRDLVEMYLNYIVGPKCYLILSIDDADTNIELGYQLLEDIRKYLIIPRVIILMAANMVQLETVVEQSYLERYKTGLSFSEKGSMITVARCHEAAELYLEKVVPGSRRIYLPSLESAFTSEFNTVTINYDIGLLDGDYQKQLVDLLHRKTGLIFLPANGYVHNFLPTKFRELAHFLSYFGAMPDCENPFFEEDAMNIRGIILDGRKQEAEEKILNWRKRLDKLEHYLVYIWAGGNLRQNARFLFQDLTHQTWNNMNRFLLYNLPRYYYKDCEESRSYTTSNYPYKKNFEELCIRKGIDLSKPEENYSYSKVVSLLDALTVCDGRERQYKLCYAIHLYYSIFVHKLFLDDLENIINGETPSISKVSAFLNDIALFQVEGVEETAFGHRTFNKIKFNKETSEIRPFFRRLVVENNVCVRYSVKPKIKDKEDEDLKNITYDPSYLLLNQMDGIAQAADDPFLGKDTNILSLIILLNWDVQKDIRRSLKTSWEIYKSQNCIFALWKCYKDIVYSTYIKLENGILKGTKLSEPLKSTVFQFLEQYKANFFHCILSGKEKKDIQQDLYEYSKIALSIIRKGIKEMTLSEWNASTEETIVKERNRADELVQKLNIYPPLSSSISPDDTFIAFRENIINNNNLKSESVEKMSMKDFAEKIKTGVQKLGDFMGVSPKAVLR